MYQAQLSAITRAVADDGFALYQWLEQGMNDEELLAASSRLISDLGFGGGDAGVMLQHENFSLLRDRGDAPAARFIPYTNRQMNWHTDGYYNDIEDTIRSFTLHCLSAAERGGELSLLDDQLVFIHMRDHHPEATELLCHPQAMMLPANTDDSGHDRPDRFVPVFSWHADGELTTRYTTRSRNIAWRNRDTENAASLIADTVSALEPAQVSVRLQSGQGIITRNVLHRRAAFVDSDTQQRKMLRGRFRQRPRMAVRNCAVVEPARRA